MPSFICDTCQETIKKPKLDEHSARCRGARFSCIDCFKNFANRQEYSQHTSCITEVEKYVEKKPIRINNEVKKEENYIMKEDKKNKKKSKTRKDEKKHKKHKKKPYKK